MRTLLCQHMKAKHKRDMETLENIIRKAYQKEDVQMHMTRSITITKHLIMVIIKPIKSQTMYHAFHNGPLDGI
jgi:hypothetical protein